MKTINYKGKGEHSVRELELIIEQQAEELHLLKSGQNQLPTHGVVKPFYCQDEYYHKIGKCKEQCITCFSKNVDF